MQLTTDSNHFMLGKCLWKMYNAPDEVRKGQPAPTVQEVVDTCVRAIETLPNRRDNRKEPILEPHYKLVSIVHKLVLRKDITVRPTLNRSLSVAIERVLTSFQTAEGVEILKATSYTKKVPVPDSAESEAWVDYVTGTLKALRAADKSGWHHRMTMRVGITIPHLLFCILTITGCTSHL
jgi:hypothetical protein